MSLNLQNCHSTASFVLLIFIVIKFSYQKLIIVHFPFIFKLYTYLTIINPCYSLPSASCNHWCFLFLWICMLCASHLMGPYSTQPMMLASTVKTAYILSVHPCCLSVALAGKRGLCYHAQLLLTLFCEQYVHQIPLYGPSTADSHSTVYTHSWIVSAFCP